MGSDRRVAGDDLGDLSPVDLFGHLAEERVRDGRRCPHRQPAVHARALATVVVDLGEDRRAVAVDGFGDAPVARHDLGMEAVDQLLVRPVRRMRRVLLGDDQAGAARGPRRVVGGVLLGGQAVLRVVREVRGEDDAIAHDHRPDAQRREQVAVPAHEAPTTTSPGARGAYSSASAARRPSRIASWIDRGATASPARTNRSPVARQRRSSGKR